MEESKEQISNIILNQEIIPFLKVIKQPEEGVSITKPVLDIGNITFSAKPQESENVSTKLLGTEKPVHITAEVELADELSDEDKLNLRNKLRLVVETAQGKVLVSKPVELEENPHELTRLTFQTWQTGNQMVNHKAGAKAIKPGNQTIGHISGANPTPFVENRSRLSILKFALCDLEVLPELAKKAAS